MYRFFLVQAKAIDGKIHFEDKEQIHHLKDVLRLKEQDKIIICDGKGNNYECAVEKIGEAVALKILHKMLTPKSDFSLTVACAIPKKAKMDDIIDKLTQLGVDTIIPIETERVIVKVDDDKKLSRFKRWQKIAISSSQQSQRCNIPVIEPIQDIKEIIKKSGNFDLKLIPTLDGQRKKLRDVLLNRQTKDIIALIGPEGDFSPQEVELAIKAGFIPISLGELVLRVDTAAIAVASYIRLLTM